MSTPAREEGGPPPVSRAAELAAQQVESIVEAAQKSAAELAQRAERDLASARKELESARQEAEQVRVLARESAKADLEAARKEASKRIADAQAAADDVLAEAKAVSGGMRQLAHLLTTHAERILRDVTNSHRAISADLRVAARDEDPLPAVQEEGPSEAERPRERRANLRPSARARTADNPFADLEPPSWVEKPS